MNREDGTAWGASIVAQTDAQNRFSELLEGHRGIVIKVASTYCWHPNDREELVQEICTQLWRAFARYDEKLRFSTWMYRVALNVAISWVRQNSIRRKRLVALDEGIGEPSEPMKLRDEDGRIAFLQRFVSTLDPMNRALVLLYLEEKSQAEIAEVLGISTSNVATKINRIKRRVREQSDAELTGENR